jgi:tRNA (mo5U34)-methyltransferase
MNASQLSRAEIRAKVEALGPWFHNLTLNGVPTAPSHFLGDYPAIKWQRFASAITSDLQGKSVLDIGCNAGFYSMEMKRRSMTSAPWEKNSTSSCSSVFSITCAIRCWRLI